MKTPSNKQRQKRRVLSRGRGQSQSPYDILENVLAPTRGAPEFVGFGQRPLVRLPKAYVVVRCSFAGWKEMYSQQSSFQFRVNEAAPYYAQARCYTPRMSTHELAGLQGHVVST